jgi:hypothetical protein
VNPARADISHIVYFTAAFFLIFLLTVSLVVPVNITFSSQTAVGGEQFPRSIIAASSTDTTPHSLELRAIQDGDNAEPKKVSGFKLDMTNVVGAQINSQVLVFVTDSSVKVSEAKVRTVSDRLIDLIPSSQANAFSLTNLPVGVYTLDIITQKGNAKAAYEGILVISQQPTTVISETTRNVINQEINQNTRVVIDDDDDGDDGRDCDPSYPGVCIPPPPPNLNCDDISFRNFKVKGSDPHGFDRDKDGIGCESNSPRPSPDPCIKNPDLPQCPVDCDENPDDPRCQVDCDENPDAEGCPTPPDTGVEAEQGGEGGGDEGGGDEGGGDEGGSN